MNQILSFFIIKNTLTTKELYKYGIWKVINTNIHIQYSVECTLNETLIFSAYRHIINGRQTTSPLYHTKIQTFKGKIKKCINLQ